MKVKHSHIENALRYYQILKINFYPKSEVQLGHFFCNILSLALDGRGWHEVTGEGGYKTFILKCLYEKS